MDFLTKLKPNPSNPRTVGLEEFERLKDKIRDFPEMLEKRPIVYDGDMILGGTLRFRALKELVKEGFVVKDSYFSDASSWSEEQKKKFVILDNVSDGQWDFDMLANEWTDLPLEDWGINLNGWLDSPQDVQNVQGMWKGMPEFEGVEEPYKQLTINFENAQDYEEFGKLLGQDITDDTRFVWYPQKKKHNLKDIQIKSKE